jgi:ABC-type multidrug transport system fused ATPase/permease subunit
MVNRTVILITHRLSSIKNADKINVIHKGKVAESGKFNELMEKQGIFKKLVDLQLGDSQ